MNHSALKTFSIYMLILIGSVFGIGLLGLSASGNHIGAISALWLIPIAFGTIGRAAGLRG